MDWNKFFVGFIGTLSALGGLGGILVGGIGALAAKPWGIWTIAGGIVGLAICTAMSKAQE